MLNLGLFTKKKYKDLDLLQLEYLQEDTPQNGEDWDSKLLTKPSNSEAQSLYAYSLAFNLDHYEGRINSNGEIIDSKNSTLFKNYQENGFSYMKKPYKIGSRTFSKCKFDPNFNKIVDEEMNLKYHSLIQDLKTRNIFPQNDISRWNFEELRNFFKQNEIRFNAEEEFLQGVDEVLYNKLQNFYTWTMALEQENLKISGNRMGLELSSWLQTSQQLQYGQTEINLDTIKQVENQLSTIPKSKKNGIRVVIPPPKWIYSVLKALNLSHTKCLLHELNNDGGDLESSEYEHCELFPTFGVSLNFEMITQESESTPSKYETGQLFYRVVYNDMVLNLGCQNGSHLAEFACSGSELKDFLNSKLVLSDALDSQNCPITKYSISEQSLDTQRRLNIEEYLFRKSHILLENELESTKETKEKYLAIGSCTISVLLLLSWIQVLRTKKKPEYELLLSGSMEMEFISKKNNGTKNDHKVSELTKISDFKNKKPTKGKFTSYKTTGYGGLASGSQQNLMRSSVLSMVSSTRLDDLTPKLQRRASNLSDGPKFQLQVSPENTMRSRIDSNSLASPLHRRDQALDTLTSELFSPTKTSGLSKYEYDLPQMTIEEDLRGETSMNATPEHGTRAQFKQRLQKKLEEKTAAKKIDRRPTPIQSGIDLGHFEQQYLESQISNSSKTNSEASPTNKQSPFRSPFSLKFQNSTESQQPLNTEGSEKDTLAKISRSGFSPLSRKKHASIEDFKVKLKKVVEEQNVDTQSPGIQNKGVSFRRKSKSNNKVSLEDLAQFSGIIKPSTSANKSNKNHKSVGQLEVFNSDSEESSDDEQKDGMEKRLKLEYTPPVNLANNRLKISGSSGNEGGGSGPLSIEEMSIQKGG